MSTLGPIAELGRQANGLTVVSALRGDGTIHASLVNAGVLPSPLDDEPLLAFVTYGKVKVANLRARPQVAATVQNGWRWATVEGLATIIGPDDPQDGFDAERLRLLLRAVFVAAGGSHDNWGEYDQTTIEQRRAAVLITPSRVYSS